MIADSEGLPDSFTWSVDILPGEVDAGAEFTVECRIEGPPDIEIDGLVVSIRDQDGSELAASELSQADDDPQATATFVLNAPRTVGEYTWRALLVFEEDGSLYEASSTGFSFLVKAHSVRLNVWDVPTAISAGERFTFKAGVKCSCGCNMAGAELRLVDGGGNEVGTGVLRAEVWPGTEALYFAEMEATAPPDAGDHEWQIRIPASATGAPHAPGATGFPVKAMAPPDCEVTIAVRDAEKGAAIHGARIVMHPYRAQTDGDGTARIKAVKGNYRLLVAATRYIATARMVEVSENLTLTAELSLEPIVDSSSYYV